MVGLIVNGKSVDNVLRSFPDLTRAQEHECPDEDVASLRTSFDGAESVHA